MCPTACCPPPPPSSLAPNPDSLSGWRVSIRLQSTWTSRGGGKGSGAVPALFLFTLTSEFLNYAQIFNSWCGVRVLTGCCDYHGRLM